MANHTIGEEWRPVVGFEGRYDGRYEVSNLGSVRGYITRWGIRKHPKYLRATDDGLGYLRFSLTDKNGTNKNIKGHRIVLLAFVGPPPSAEKRFCNHKNGVRSDNRVENLEWVTHTENIQHAKNVLKSLKTRRGEAHPAARLTDKLVREMRKRKSRGETYEVLSKCYGVSTHTIYLIVKGKKWKHVQ